MKIIWTFTLLMIPGVVSSISVTGYSGGGVNITCTYDREYTDNAKYFCRGEWSTCSDLIRTDKKNKWVDSGRFSLFDYTRAAVFTVTFRDLSEQDSGMYWCAVDISLSEDPYTEVNLKVVTDLCLTGEQISAVTGYSGGDIIINYKYEMNHENHQKYFCEAGAYQCFTRIHTDRAAEWTHVGRFSVHDDRSARLLRVFIRELNENDSGEYKIIVKVSEDYSFFSEFKLDVKKDVPNTTSSSSTSSVFKPSASVSSDMSKGSSLIIFLVLVLLVLIIVGLLLLFLYKKHQSRGVDSSSQTGAGKHEAVSHTGYDYDEIKDTHSQLPTNPSDSSNTVYASAQLPTNPSDSANCVYSTVQEASGDSQIFITSAEDLNYAVVNFQKKADCPDRVSLRNNQDYSEYTAVNYLTSHSRQSQ